MQTIILSLTLFRIIAAPFIFFFAIFEESYWVTFWLFNAAASTDYLDGKLARHFNVESRLGAILDPIGDKMLVLFALITVIVFTENIYLAFIVTLILAREFWVSALREYNGSNDLLVLTKVTFIAKVKTTFQFVAISMYFLGAALGNALIIFLANFILLLSALLSIKSAIEYTLNSINP